MQIYFNDLFSRNPHEIIDNDYYYNADDDGDNFDEADEKGWLNGRFKSNWEGKLQGRGEISKICGEIAAQIAGDGKPYLEIVCGPGMGLTPSILAQNPNLPCLASDACSRLIKAWRQYINISELKQHNISLASFSAFDIPLKDNSLDYVTSFLGIGSTRSGLDGQMQALREVYRILKPGGSFVAIEGEFVDMAKVDEVFKRWGKHNWYSDKAWQTAWRDKFTTAGFKIDSCVKHYLNKWTKDSNDFGEAAEQFEIDVFMRYNLYILRKD